MSKQVLITGANRGIGLALCQVYLKKGYHVVAACRQPSDELVKLKVEIIEGIDVSVPDSVESLAGFLHGKKIDILINNAGILRSQRLDDLNFDHVIEQFEVNAVGPMRVVDALLNNLTEGSKIAMITSRMGSIEDNTSGGAYGYRMSKCALNAAGKSMAHDLKPRGISVALLHPGYVQTEMVNHGGDISADEAAERLAKRIEELNLENTGTFWHSNGEVLPW